MNKLIKWIMVLAVTIAVGSCDSGSFLNETPTAEQTESNFYTTPEQAEQALNDGYRQMRLIAFFWYSKTTFGDIMSNDAAKGGGGASDQADIQLLKTFNAKPTNGYLDNAWQFNYRGVYLANLVIQKVPGIDMDESQKSRIIAEAKFLRGYFYLQLVRIFGNIPLITKPLKNGEFDQPQVKSDKIWAQIKKDANDAIQNLPSKNELSADKFGHATKGAAQALLLNVYMWEKNWTEAQKLGDSIINSGSYNLDPDYYHMWSTDGEFGPGSIFEINYAFVPGRDIGNYLPSWEGIRPSLGIGFVCPTQDLVDAFEPGDPRLDITVIKPDEKMPDGTVADTKNSPTGYYTQKYWLPKDENPQFNGGGFLDFPTNERVYRLATIMLWTAEAAFHNGNVARATSLVNRVRDRARNSGGNQDMTVLPDYGSVTLKDIYHEERVETALGGHRRFFNLVRTGRAATVLPGFKTGVNEIFPIPQREVQLSDGKLKQNPGY